MSEFCDVCQKEIKANQCSTELVLCSSLLEFHTQNWKYWSNAKNVIHQSTTQEMLKGKNENEIGEIARYLCSVEEEKWEKISAERMEQFIRYAANIELIQNTNKKRNHFSNVCDGCLHCNVCRMSDEDEDSRSFETLIHHTSRYHPDPIAALQCSTCKKLVCFECNLINDRCFRCFSVDCLPTIRKDYLSTVMFVLPAVCATLVVDYISEALTKRGKERKINRPEL